MGSLYQKPKTPAASVASTPAASPSATTASGAITAGAATDTAAGEDAQKAAGIVRKNRSLPATVLTSFRGVLDVGDWVPARKNLLGE